jgi:hypothetical protein
MVSDFSATCAVWLADEDLPALPANHFITSLWTKASGNFYRETRALSACPIQAERWLEWESSARLKFFSARKLYQPQAPERRACFWAEPT